MSKVMVADWPLVPLREVLTSLSRPEAVDPHTTYRILGAHLYAQGLYTKEIKRGLEIRADKLYRVEQGDFVYNRLFAWKGSFAVATAENHNCCVSNEFRCFEVTEDKLDSDYLWRYFSQESIWAEALGLSSGSTPTSRNRLKEEKFLAMTIGLPPLEEQRRIVERLEELACRIKEARSIRQIATKETESLESSVLASVFAELVAKHGDRRLADLINKAGYGTSVRCEFERVKGSVPVLRIPNVASEHINFEAIKYGVLSEAELLQTLLHAGDLLIVRTNGSLDLVGRGAVVPELAEPTAFASYLIRIRCSEEVTPEYLRLMLKHLRINGQLLDLARTTAGQYNISLGRLRSARMPVPNIEEQRRVVSHMDQFQTKADILKRLQLETSRHFDRLLPSILSKAFDGNLVRPIEARHS